MAKHTYATDDERYEAIHARTIAKLRPPRPDLAGLSGDALVRDLVVEALAEFYDDQITANYAWAFVERVVRRAIEAAAAP